METLPFLICFLLPGLGKPAATRENLLADFPDAASVSSECRAAMEWAVENGIVGGTKAGTLEPAGLITRGAFSAILHRYLDK